jgi:UDP-glucose 4-epimerase
VNSPLVTPPGGASPRHVLVTGGAGFIGTHLVQRLLAGGERVTVLDNHVTSTPDSLAASAGHPNLEMLLGDVVGNQALDGLVARADVVIHLAAAVGVKLVVEEPLRTLETNIAGTEAILSAAARHGAKVLMASTSEVYGKSTQLPFREDSDVVHGATSKSRWGYAASKMVDEFFALAYHATFDLPVVIFRLFNTVGPGQTGRYGMVVPRFVDAALRGEPLIVHDDGAQRRCFLHVADAIVAIDALSRTDAAIGQVFNIGSEQPVSILELAERVIERVAQVEPARPRSSIEFLPYDQVYGAGFEDMRARQPDITKIGDIVGWTPTRSLDDILTDVITEKRRLAALV